MKLKQIKLRLLQLLFVFTLILGMIILLIPSLVLWILTGKDLINDWINFFSKFHPEIADK